MSALKSTANCLGYQQITSLSTPKNLSMPAADGNPVPAFALVNVEAQAVRWRDDGIDPTPTVGMLVPAGSGLQYDGDMQKIRFIAVSAGAILNVSLYN